jgi:MFS family permease
MTRRRAAEALAARGFQLLRNADFARYTCGRVCITLGWQILGVAVGWQVYELTHDPLALGLVGLCEFLPFVTLVLAGGHTADHVNRQRILVTMCCVETSCAAALLWFSVAGITRPWPIYAATAIFGMSRAFWMPAMQAYLMNIVSRENFSGALAFDSTLRQLATVCGPVLGGLLYIWGPQPAYALLCALFLCAALLMFSIGAPPQARQAASSNSRTHELLEGIRFVLRHSTLLGCISLDLFAVLFGGAVALLPIYARDILHTGPAGLGLLRSAPAVGAAIVGAVLAARPLRHHAGAWLFGGVTLFGVATLVFGISTSFWLSLAALAVAGAGDMVSVFVRLTLTQLSTPDAIRGRVSAVNSMFIGASNELGAFESGVMARWFGTVPSVLVGGCATLVVVAVWAAAFPQLRRVPPLK